MIAASCIHVHIVHIFHQYGVKEAISNSVLELGWGWGWPCLESRTDWLTRQVSAGIWTDWQTKDKTMVPSNLTNWDINTSALTWPHWIMLKRNFDFVKIVSFVGTSVSQSFAFLLLRIFQMFCYFPIVQWGICWPNLRRTLDRRHSTVFATLILPVSYCCYQRNI